MNNNNKFDPMTGQPLQNNNDPVPVTQQEQPVNQQIVEQNTTLDQSQESIQVPVQDVVVAVSEDNNTNQEAQIQNQLQSIPTVGQNKQDFINNVQSMNQEKKEIKKERASFIFITILFVVILVTIYFLFPLLLDYI